MKEGDILVCIKDFVRDSHLHYQGGVYSEIGIHEYQVLYKKNKSYIIHSTWPESNLVNIWRPIKDAVKLGLSPNAQSDNVIFNHDKEHDGGYKIHLWDYFVTEEEYINMKRKKILDKIFKTSFSFI